jgi:catechol 2,3-dioxygenase-like lactoylglutathione lyase family enzyme
VLTAANVIAFLAVTDAERARRFYEGTLGLVLIEQSDAALIFETRGAELRVTVVEDFTPEDHTVLGWNVADACHTARRLREAGVELERYGSLEQDELGVWEAPGGARVAWFRDPDGNLLSIAQT